MKSQRLLTILVIIACLLYACTPAPTTPSAPNAHEQEIVLWHSLSGSQESALLQVIDDFNTRNQWGITVAAERQGNLNDLRTRILSGHAHGALPDLAVADSQVAADWARAGASLPLDEYLSHAEYGLGQQALADVVFDARQPHFGNQVISWPLGREMVVLLYNMKWLKEIGLETPPDRWDEFEAIACAASRDADNDGAYDHFGYAYVRDTTALAGWLYSRNVRVLSADGQHVEFAAPEGLETFRWLNRMFDNACAGQAGSPAQARRLFADSHALFTFARSSELPDYAADVAAGSNFPFGVAPMPGTTLTPTVALDGPDFVLFRTTPDRQLAAWLVMRFFTDPPQAARWTELTGQFPVRRIAAEGDLLAAYRAAQPRFAITWAMLPQATSEPATSGWPAIRDLLTEALDAVADGAPPGPTVRAVEQHANEVLTTP